MIRVRLGNNFWIESTYLWDSFQPKVCGKSISINNPSLNTHHKTAFQPARSANVAVFLLDWARSLKSTAVLPIVPD
jgi:hypothetical protein